MNLCIWSQYSDRLWFMTDVGIFPISVVFRFPLWLPFGAIAVSCKWIYNQDISVMIQLRVAEGSPEGMYKVVSVVMCGFETRRVVVCKACKVERVDDAGSVLHMGGKENRGKGGKKVYIFSIRTISWINLFCWSTSTKWPNLLRAQPPGTTWLRSHETRCSTRGAESLPCQVLLLHCTPLLLLRPHAAPSKLSSSWVVPTVPPSNMATNMPSGGKSTPDWYHRIENASLFALQFF